MKLDYRRVQSTVALILATLTLILTMPAAARAASSPAPSSTPAKWACLVGINDYKYPDRVSSLAGSINDVEDMLQVLTTKYEFPRENIVVLKNAEATHAAIIDCIRNHLIAKSKPGDIVVFHDSSHGSQMKDVTGKKVSGLDETIVPYDSRDPEGKVFDISGAELHGLLLQLAQKTPNVTVILDSCHSGTLVRDISARARMIAADTRTPPPLPSYAAATTRGLSGGDEGPPLKYAFISAATSKESAYEHVIKGVERGALTYFLAQQLRSARAGATYRDVMDAVIGNVTANYPAQHPSLEGVEADQQVFGVSTSIARSYVVVNPLDARRATLAVGDVEGATVGSVYEVYAPGAKKFASPEQPVAKIQITKTDAFSAEANIISGGKIAAASRAVEREHRFGSSKMWVYLDGVDGSPVLKSIRDALQPLKQIEVRSARSGCHMQIRQAQGKIQTLGADYTTLSPPVDVNDSNAVDHVVSQVKSWAKYFSVLSIRNPSADIDVQFGLKGNQTRDPMARMGRPDMGVWAGESIEATLHNNSERDLYIAILDLDSDGSINVVYPSVEGEKSVLTPGSTLTRTFNTSVPRGRSRTLDVLKVFASYKPIDLTPLKQGATRDIPASNADPLQDLLMDSTGTRAIAPQNSAPLGSWTTVDKVLVVKRKG